VSTSSKSSDDGVDTILPQTDTTQGDCTSIQESPSQPAGKRVYVIVLNWNGWRDTIECLESVVRLDYPNYRVVVCDNSSDGSLEQIRKWAKGEMVVETRNPILSALTSPPVAKSIPFVELGRAEAEMGSGDTNSRLVLIQTGANRGFGGGNNVALRYALNRGDCDFAWLLNNDTVATPDALSHLVHRMGECPNAGICGSTLLYYDDPSKVQAFGGSTYNKWLARGRHIGKLADAAQIPKAHEVEPQMAYVIGASMLVRRSFLEQVGLLNEEYFVYYDELDWATRAKGRFQLAYSPLSIVYHKEGAAIGSHRTHLSPLAEFYMVRNRLLFTRRYYPRAIPSVLVGIGLSAIRRSLKFRWRNVGALISGGLQGIRVSMSSGKREL
jgi:GT2 family glycosyltransferase